jgi:hypothetical protein
MISDAYQLIILEPKELNYHVLVSLNSFNKYVTKSIRQALFKADIENSLTEFESNSQLVVAIISGAVRCVRTR